MLLLLLLRNRRETHFLYNVWLHLSFSDTMLMFYIVAIVDKFMAPSRSKWEPLSGHLSLSLRAQTFHMAPSWGDIYPHIWIDLYSEKLYALQRIRTVRKALTAFATITGPHLKLTPCSFSCVLLCEVVTDEKSGRESVMRVHCKEDNDCTRWAPVLFFCVYVFNTNHIGVYTAGVEWKCQYGLRILRLEWEKWKQ